MYIFLSYSRADLAYAEKIEANLKQAGHEVFLTNIALKSLRILIVLFGQKFKRLICLSI